MRGDREPRVRRRVDRQQTSAGARGRRPRCARRAAPGPGRGRPAGPRRPARRGPAVRRRRRGWGPPRAPRAGGPGRAGAPRRGRRPAWAAAAPAGPARGRRPVPGGPRARGCGRPRTTRRPRGSGIQIVAAPAPSGPTVASRTAATTPSTPRASASEAVTCCRARHPGRRALRVRTSGPQLLLVAHAAPPRGRRRPGRVRASPRAVEDVSARALSSTGRRPAGRPSGRARSRRACPRRAAAARGASPRRCGGRREEVVQARAPTTSRGGRPIQSSRVALTSSTVPSAVEREQAAGASPSPADLVPHREGHAVAR